MAEDLDDLYENAPCGYLSLGPDGKIVKSNRTLSTWLGRPQNELIGLRLRDLLNIAGAMFYETHFAPLLRMQGSVHEIALDFVAADGKVLPALVSAVEKHDDAGALSFTRLTIFQAAERRRYERDLVEGKAAAEQGLAAERATSLLREQFVAVLGHDLRNPLASIEAGIHILKRRGLGPDTGAIVELMLGSASRIHRLIDDVLDLTRSRLGSGIPVQIERDQQLAPVLGQVVDELRSANPDRQLDYVQALDTPVDCDPGRIAQLLSNLLGNAITHGSVDVLIRVTATSDASALVIAVTNGGAPIPPEKRERLFEPFYRGDQQSSATGLGLGLFIASQIALAHDGRIEVVSSEAETRFTLSMPTRHRER